MLEYAKRITRVKCDGDAVAAEQWIRRHAHLARTLRTDDASIEAEVCFRVEDDVLVFTPSEIIPTRIVQAQRAQHFAMHVARREHEHLHVVIDMRDMTYSGARAVLSASSPADMHNGLELWATLPVKVKSIEVRKPRDLPGWGTLVRVGQTFMSSKMRGRLHIVE